jgi:hypothetical protein
MLSLLDINGKYFNFFINKRNKYQTNIGALLSIIEITILIIVSINYLQEVINKTKPSTTFLKLPSTLISHYEDILKFRINDQNANLQDSRFLELFVEYRNMQNEVIDRDSVSKECNDSGKNYSCIEFGEDYLDTSTYLDIYIRRCDNSTEFRKNVKCASNDQITTSSINLEMSYKQYYINPLNYTSQIGYESNIDTIEMSLGMKKTYELTIRQNELIIDNGIVFEDYTITEYNTIRKSFIDKTSDNSVLLQFNVKIENIKDVYIIRYKKLVDSLSSIGGFYLIVNFIFTVIYACYLESQYKLYILNNYYDYHIEDEPSYHNKLNLSIIRKANNSQRTLRRFTDVTNRKATADRTTALKTNKLNIKNVWFYDLIRFNCRKQRHQEYVYRFIYKVYRNEFDIINFMKKMNRLDLFKSAYLNRQQNYMLSHSKKRQIICEINNQSDDYEQVQFQKLLNYLHENKISNTLSELDHYMLKQMDETFKNEIFKVVEVDEMETQ